MAPISWSKPGSRLFESGVDRCVLYVGSNPGVPWMGVTSVEAGSSGGDVKERYLDGVMISNYAEPENFEGSIEAFTYPREFEPCDGISSIANGLRAMQQPRKPFNLSYRTKIGNELNELGYAYRLHFIFNVRAEPASRGFKTLGGEVEPTTMNWSLKARHSLINGLRPTSYLSLDSREVPAELLKTIEDILYGTEITSPRIPSAAELAFLFDSFLDNVYDAGDPLTPVFVTYDAGTPSTTFVNTIDGGAL